MCSMISVCPEVVRYELLLTANTAVSHHDPATQDESNRLQFNRQKQLLTSATETVILEQAALDVICGQHMLPRQVVNVFQDLTFGEFIGTTLTRMFLDMYNGKNGGEGEGLFSGMERYERLETRLRAAAVASHTLRAWWDRLCSTLQVGIHPGEYDTYLLDLLSLPRGVQQAVLRSLVVDYRSIVALARYWHSTMKLRSDEYAAKAGKHALVEPLQALHFDVATLPAVGAVQVIDVPAVSGNSLRHQVVREPSWLHLAAALGLSAESPGKGPVPAGVEAIFYNGGNIEAGAKQPSNTFSLAQRIREAYPSLDLLGGVTDSFDIGESRLKLVGWIVCRENREALRGSPAYDLPSASVSVFDLVDDVTLTRQAGRTGVGQMIYSFETLCSGVQVLCRMALSPFTRRLTRGALVAAAETFLDVDNTIGGQSARGFGDMTGQWLTRPDADDEVLEEYEAYLAENREGLVQGLRDGTLGTGAVILS